jgi:hypothetical protein
MVPPALSAHFYGIARGWLPASAQPSQLLAVGHQATLARQAGTERERNGHEIVTITDRTRLAQRGGVMVRNPTEFGLGITDFL